MSLNQLIDGGTVNNRKWLDVKVNSMNIVSALELDGDAGNNGEVVVRGASSPQWGQIASGGIAPGPNDTFLFTRGGLAQWVNQFCRVASFAPAGKTFLNTEPGAQDLANVGPDNVVYNKFANTLIANTSIITRSVDQDEFTVVKAGIYQITLCAPVYENDNSVWFAYIIDGLPATLTDGWQVTTPIDTDVFVDIPGQFFNGAGQATTLMRYFDLFPGQVVRVVSGRNNSKGGIFRANYYVGNNSASLSFLYLGENQTA